MNIESVAVFCGSQAGNNPVYLQHAIQLGEIIANQNMTLVYGGGNGGLMGTVANTVMGKGGNVIGVITELLSDREHHHKGITKLHIVSDMHVRKKMMYELCDMAIILPGGFGTLDELFEMITWNALKIHEKKIVILNSGNYYHKMMEFMDHIQQETFLYEDWRARIQVANSPEEIFLIHTLWK